MFAVAGVTGHTGKVVAEALLAKGKQVRVLARDASKVEAFKKRGAQVAVVDFNQPESLAQALAGVEGAYLLLPPDPLTPEFMERGRRLVTAISSALKKAPVPHVVFLSSIAAQHAAGTGPIKSVHHAEQELPKLVATRFTFVRASYFMDNLLMNLGLMRDKGILPVFGGGESFPFPMVATSDVGETAAQALLEAPRASQVIELAGPKEYSLQNAAQVFSTELGKPVTAQVMPLDAMVPALVQAGLSEDVAKQYREMTEAMGKGLMAFEGGSALGKRGAVTLEAFVKRALAA